MGNGRVRWVSDSNLSKHAGALRLSLLAALGLAPGACGGMAIETGEAQAGAADTGGASDRGGASFGGVGSALVGGSGGATPAGGTAGATPMGGAGGGAPYCESPMLDSTTGIVYCANGFSHRSQAVTCNGGAAGAPSSSSGDGGVAGVPDTCTQDSDCAGLPLGYCFVGPYNPGGSTPPRVCVSGCQQDSDCGTGFCECSGTGHGQCVGNCRTDADCGADSLCASESGTCSFGVLDYACTRKTDECLTSADCKPGFYCDSRRCDNLVCGRPFLVAEAPRLAPLNRRSDWLNAGINPALSDLSVSERAALGAHWARLGQMEHASIAAFARFNMQLLALGAPGELVEACNRATADETAHTRLCFALASKYSGTHLGPGKLEVRGSMEDVSLTAIVKLVIREGCLGETVASLEALEAASLATDPAAKCVLSRIAQDEQSHAELAFKFLSWALSECSPEQRAELALEAAQSLANFERSVAIRGASQQAELTAHGMLSSQRLHAIHLAALNGIVRPLLESLFNVQRLRHCAEPGIEAITA